MISALKDFNIIAYNFTNLQIHSYVMIRILTNSTPLFWTCAIKTAATASYRAVPSMLIVAPTGSMKRVTRESIPKLSSKF